MPVKIVRCGLEREADYLERMENVPGGKKAVLVVPDQYSYMAEKKVSKKFGGTGLNGKIVMTFRQMKRNFLNLNDSKYLSPAGKKMLISYVAEKVIDEDSVFYASKKSGGFIDRLGEILCEFKRYCVTEETLTENLDEVRDRELLNKLKTILAVQKEFEKRLADGGFADSEDDLERVCKAIGENGYFKDTYVWFDRFTDFSPQHIRVIEAMAKSGAYVTVYLPAKTDGDVLKNSLYEFPEKTVSDIEKMCVKNSIEIKQCQSEKKRNMKSAFSAFAENFETAGYKYDEPAEEIQIFQAKEKYGEVEHTALKIADLVKEDGYKYSEIAVVCANLEEYATFIEPIFFEYHIPYFSDYKIALSEHSIAVLINSLFDITGENPYGTDACIRYLKTGFAVEGRCADLAENHVISRGIKGNMWLNPKYWTGDEKKVFDGVTGAKVFEKDNSELEEIRKEIITPIESFREKTKGKKKVSDMCRALYEFTEDICLFDKISESIERFYKNGRDNEALRLEKIWNLLVELTEQAVVAIGDEEVLRGEFAEIIKCGMSGSEINIIPSATEGVSVAGADRFAAEKPSVVFVLGANKNAFPSVSMEEGILTDSERETISAELAPTAVKKSAQAEFKAISLLLSPSKLLHISFPVSDIGGEMQEPSQLVYDLCDMFEHLQMRDNLVDDGIFYISSPEATIHKLLLKMSDELSPLWEKVKKWYEKDGRWEDKLRLIDAVSRFKTENAKISSENAELLYENYTSMSISKIEKYFECPFRYFLENGLKIKEREKWEIGSTDTGSLLHWAVSEYCVRVEENAFNPAEKKQKWDDLSDEKSRELIREILMSARENAEFSESDAGKAENMIDRVQKALEGCIPIINISMKNGKYSGAAYEAEFGDKEIKNSDGSVKIRGIIDRVDIYEDKEAGKAYIRVIDYKSGKKGYSLERILNRVDLQLAVYAIAAAQMYKNKEFSGFEGDLEPDVKGIFYDKINNKYIECGYSERDFAKEKRLSALKLDGVIFSREEGSGKTVYFDTADAENMDREIAQSGVSRYLKVAKKAKGKGIDKQKSSVESDETKDAVLKWVRDGLILADKNIKEGKIDVSPYKGESADGACAYCPYTNICAQDKEKGGCTRKTKSAKEILKEITGGE